MHRCVLQPLERKNNHETHRPIRWFQSRMPKALAARAKKRSGIASDTELIQLALANIAVADDYADWPLSRRGTIDPRIDLGF